MCPILSSQVVGPKPAKFICHVLLIETENDGLVLVDTGLGVQDIEQRHKRLGRFFTTVSSPSRDVGECALHQIERLGFTRSDVRHLVLTHLDLDHAGGMPDFPEAQVHVMHDEHAAAMRGRDPRWVKAHWAHDVHWNLYTEDAGEDWFGFKKVRSLQGLTDDILMLPLSGHSPGHACVAVRNDKKWLLHCGDAYFHRNSIRPDDGRAPWGARVFERFVAVDHKKVLENHRRLAELNAQHPEVDVFCAHDESEFKNLESA